MHVKMKSGDTREGPVWGSLPGSLMNDALIAGASVCFCDIPIADLAIHIQHYSSFALAFRKEFLIQRGASPVFYVARDANIGDPSKRECRLLGDELDKMGNDLIELQQFILKCPDSPKDSSGRELFWAFSTLSSRVLGFVKGFDALSPPVRLLISTWSANGEFGVT